MRHLPATSVMASTMLEYAPQRQMLPLMRSRNSALVSCGCAEQVCAHVAGNAGLDFREHRDGGADLPGRAIAALIAVVFDERGLHGMHLVGRAQAFDGGDAIAFVHHRQREAGIDAPSARDHRAGAALAVIAALLGAGEMQVIAQRIEQRGARVELERVWFAVDLEASPSTITGAAVPEAPARPR